MMNSNVKFSIIVPIYNAESTLAQCINSILGQDYDSFELILVNDGSLDGSGELCDIFSSRDERITVVHKENGGVSSARNVGLLTAKGEWLVFVDADDTVDESWLSIYAANVEKGKHVIVTQRAKMIEGTAISEVLHWNYKGLVDKDMFYIGGQYGYLWNKCFNRQLVESAKIKFDETMNCFEDEIFVLEYSRYASSFYIPDSTPQYNYYLPNFSSKYQRDSTFSRQYYRYCKTKSISLPASTILVDWLIMTMLKECAECSGSVREYAIAIKKSVGKDIKYAYGLKKIFLRSARVMNFSAWWICMVWLYSRAYKLGFLK